MPDQRARGPHCTRTDHRDTVVIETVDWQSVTVCTYSRIWLWLMWERNRRGVWREGHYPNPRQYPASAEVPHV